MAELNVAPEVAYTDDDYFPAREGGTAGLKKAIFAPFALYLRTKLFGSFVGQAGKVPTVNPAEDAFIWGTGGGGGGGGTVAFKGAMVRKAADQTAANYTVADVIAWDAEAYDVGNWHSNVTNNSRLVVLAGVTRVVVTANVALTSVAASDFISISLLKNGANNFEGASGSITDASLASPFASFKSAPISVVPGDYFEVRLGIESDTSVTVIADRSNFSIQAVESTQIPSGYFHAREVQASGVAGSASVAAWTTRVLNTIVANDMGASLAANQITLPAGTYDIKAFLNVFSASSMGHKARLRNITNGVTLLEGMSMWGSASVERPCPLQGRFSLTATTIVAVQMIATGVVAAGWGVNAGLAGETNILADVIISVAGYASNALTENLLIGASDEITALTTGTAKITFRMPYAFTVTGIRASLATAQASGTIFTVDVNEGGVSILSTKLTIDNTEKTSVTAAALPVISDTALADDAEISIDIDQIGDGTAKGLKVTLIGYRT